MSIGPLLIMAALSSAAIFMHILSCVLFNNWWPLLLVLGYLVMPFPVALVLRNRGDGFMDTGGKAAQHWGEFISAFVFTFIVGVPWILLRGNVVELGAVLMDLAGLLFVIAAVVYALFTAAYQPEEGFGMFN
uniref:Vacuolar protein sorting 55 n=1 Tax=Chrysotila carterae TaxID=13221 RepID=A0A7S4ESY9_CHRCT|mmetsp:Transcript_36395/g.79972  ORF Transcript_36395/g.79972 Transcript_36395/m.79972 type:complete len:132 (+) Transcript_36395:428-823(+)